MSAYCSLLVAIILFAFVEFLASKLNKISYYYFYVIVAVLFICIAGLANGNGLDWDSYQEISELGLTFRDIGFHSSYEPFFLLLYNIFPSYHIFLFFFVLINFILLSKTILRYSPYVAISILVYVCTYYFWGMMGQLRQALAISIIVFAWPYIESRKFVIYVLIASLFHYSAIVCLLYLLIPNFLYKKKYYIAILFVAIFLCGLIQGLMKTFLEGFVGGKILYYLSEDGGISIIFFFYKLFVFFMFLSVINRVESLLPKYKILNIYFLSILLYLLLSFSASIGGRIVLYFSVFEILIIPFIIHFYWKKKTGLLVFMLFLILNIYQFFSFLFSYSDIFVPYKCLFL